MTAIASWKDCVAACRRLLDALDWKALGAIYFHRDGEAFWHERRPRVVDLGIELAKALLQRAPAGGTSLWAGAGVAELPVLVAETAIARRTVVAVTTRARECAVLNRGLAQAGLDGAIRFEQRDAADAAAAGGYDHLGCISLFTDPETWPELSGVAYGRIAPVQLDVARFTAERERARALAERLFAGLAAPGWITTSAEEVGWFLEQAQRAGRPCEADGDAMLATAVVGDPVGFLRCGAARR